MTANNKKDKEKAPHKGYSLTKKGRRFTREERYLRNLSERERMAYEECMALIQLAGEDSSLEEVCEWLEKYAADKEDQ